MNQSAASNWQAASGRRTALLEAIRRQGETVVQPLAEQFGVSAETLRRDLRHLESRGAIQRAYGMVRPVESGAFETPLDSRVQTNVAEKERIALAAVGQLGDAQTLYIDEGFNPQLVAQHLPTDRALMVATPSLPTAVLLAQWPNVEVIILGGRVRHNTLGVVDETARHMLS
ncbi:MAG: DeoR/GlpR family DNA-binding transcription regulator, partial [Propionibacteriaceae bacterium]|nr:DeoR/GlpR family DNA-binding transcription regulator [Propionibacteriaceae bacterium]